MRLYRSLASDVVPEMLLAMWKGLLVLRESHKRPAPALLLTDPLLHTTVVSNVRARHGYANACSLHGALRVTPRVL